MPPASGLPPVSWRNHRGRWALQDTGQVLDPEGTYWQVAQARVTAHCVLLRLRAVGHPRPLTFSRSLVLWAGCVPAPVLRRLKVRLRFALPGTSLPAPGRIP